MNKGHLIPNPKLYKMKEVPNNQNVGGDNNIKGTGLQIPKSQFLTHTPLPLCISHYQIFVNRFIKRILIIPSIISKTHQNF